MKEKTDISNFLDDSGKITRLSQKNRLRTEILRYLAGKFLNNHSYTEKEVNSICEEWHTFGDFFILRREMIDYQLLHRESDGSRYWKS